MSVLIPVQTHSDSLPILSLLRRFQVSPFSPAVQDVPTFFRLLSRTLLEVFDAELVTIWNNNVYGPCLVLLGSAPDRLADDGALTIARKTSYTGKAIADCDVVYIDLRTTSNSRKFEDPQIIDRLGLTHLISAPITNPFDHQFISAVANIYFKGSPSPLAIDRQVLDSIRLSTSIALDYLFYRIEEDVRRTVAAFTPSATGIAPLFEVVARDITARLHAASSTVFTVTERVDGQGSVIHVAGSSNIREAMSRYIHPLVENPGATHEEQCLFKKAIRAKKAFMLSQENSRTDAIGSRGMRWNYMAVPILSSNQTVLGVLQCEKDDVDGLLESFSAFDLHLLDSYQRALAPAIERFQSLRKSSLHRFVDTVISATVGADNLEESLNRALTAVAHLFNASAASIYLLRESTTGDKSLIIAAAFGLDLPLMNLPATYAIGEGITGDILVKGLLNFRTEEERQHYPNRKGKFNTIVNYRLHDRSYPAFLGVPILGRERRPLGVLKVEYIEPSHEHPEAYFTDDDEQIASIIVAFVSFLVEHQQYKEKLLDEFKLLAQNSIEIERSYSEHAAIVAVMGALERSGWGDALLSLYDPSTQRLSGFQYVPFEGHQSRLGHYYRHLFQLVSFVHSQRSDIAKYEYIKTIRAQLSTHEQAMLMLNSLTPLGHQWWKQGLMVDYRLVHNLPQNFFDPNSEVDLSIHFGPGYFEWEESRSEASPVGNCN